MKLRYLIFALFFIGMLIPSGVAQAQAERIPAIPVKGMVTMVDLGAGSCIPCKMMEPILKKVEERYKDKAAIVFIDLRYHRDQAARFKVRAIPTQVFFDSEGKEVYRHVGFMSEDAIIEQLGKMGVQG
jgi:thioredoxin 1